jgi:hypothetical protein
VRLTTVVNLLNVKLNRLKIAFKSQFPRCNYGHGEIFHLVVHHEILVFIFTRAPYAILPFPREKETFELWREAKESFGRVGEIFGTLCIIL